MSTEHIEFLRSMTRDVEELKNEILETSKIIRARTKRMEEFLELNKEKTDV